MRVLVVVTHLLGTGHLRRAMNLCNAFAGRGHEVHLASGGMPVETIESNAVTLVQLSPLRSDGTNFTRLLDANGEVADDDYLGRRIKRLNKLLLEFQPEIVITELFPFGRRMLRREFCSLLETTRSLASLPVVLSSVRDILAAPSSDKKAALTETWLDHHYDGVLVHSDPETTPLNVSWPVTDVIQSKIFYTGYVAQSIGKNVAVKSATNEVVVSAGGGSVGKQLYEVAIETASILADTRWRILVGGKDAPAEVQRLKILAQKHAPKITQKFTRGSNVVIEPNRPDFRELLANAACSVSMCGYNTAIDLLLTGTPGVLIPFDAGGEQEQTLRASSLASRDAYVSLLAKDLTPESLARSVGQVTQSGRFDIDKKQFNGALESVRIATMLKHEKMQRNPEI